jgi:hypothetical protein
MNAQAASVLNQRGFGKIFSTSTKAESSAIQIQVHHAQHEQQQHQQPATAYAVEPVPNAHRERAEQAPLRQ